jgi:hypothetical protein
MSATATPLHLTIARTIDHVTPAVDPRPARGKHRAPSALARRLRLLWETARPVGMITVAGMAAVAAAVWSA